MQLQKIYRSVSSGARPPATECEGQKQDARRRLRLPRRGYRGLGAGSLLLSTFTLLGSISLPAFPATESQIAVQDWHRRGIVAALSDQRSLAARALIRESG